MAKEVHCEHLTLDPWSCHTLQLPEALSVTGQWTEGQQQGVPRNEIEPDAPRDR